MALFRKDGSPYWWYSITFNGHRYRKSTKETTKSAAETVEADVRLQLRDEGGQAPALKRMPTLGEFAVRFLGWVEKSQRLRPTAKRYYRYGWRLLELTELAKLPLSQITKDEAESIVFKRPVADKKTRKVKMLPCSNHYTNQALRTLKRMQSKALEWKILRTLPKITLADAAGRDRIISPEVDSRLEQAYTEPSNHPRVRKQRKQAWLAMVMMEDSGIRPNELFSILIENIHWDDHQIWIPNGKTKKSRRFVPMSDRMEEMLREWCGPRTRGWLFPSTRSKSGHLTTIAKGFQAARDRAGLDKKVVPYLARHTYGTITMKETKNVFAVADSMGHVDLKSMAPYQHQEIDPLRDAINRRNRARKAAPVAAPGENQIPGHNPGHTDPMSE